MATPAEDGKLIAAADTPEVPSATVLMANTANVLAFPFDDLPTELIIRIFYFAVDPRGGTENTTFDTLFPYTAMLVSKRWHRIALAAPELWTSFGIVFSNALNYSHTVRLLKDRAIRSRNRPLDLDACLKKDCHKNWKALLRSQEKHFPRWASLCVRGAGHLLLPVVLWTSKIQEVETIFQTVESLALIDEGNAELLPVGYMALTDWIAKILFNMPCLKALHTQMPLLHKWQSKPGPSLAVGASLLQELILEDIDPDALILFCRVDFPNLRTLAIQSQESLAPSEFEKQFNQTVIHLPALTSVALYQLDLRNAMTIISSDPDVQYLAVSAPNLQILSDPVICPKLTHLIVHNTAGTTSSRMRKSIEKRLPTMERLSVSKRFWEGMGAVDILDVDWCKVHVKLEWLEEKDMEFGLVCHRLSSTGHYSRAG